MKLEIQDLVKSFGYQKAINIAHLSIPECSSIAIIGPSGSGKSTFLNLLAGLTYPTKGKIFLDNKEIVFEEKTLQKHRLKIGIVFQSWNLFPHFTALQNISLPLHYVHGLTGEEAENRGMEFLKRFNLEKHALKKPAELSGGQCQRVAIIRAIAIRPKLILLDEPTSALDPLMTSEVFDLISELKKEGSHLIIATHHLSFAKKIADWTVFFQEGKVIEANTTTSFFNAPKTDEVKLYLTQVLKY